MDEKKEQVGAAIRVRKRLLNKLQLPLTQKKENDVLTLFQKEALKKVCWLN